MALNDMEIGLLFGLIAFAGLLAGGTYLLGAGNTSAGIALTVVGALGVVAFMLALFLANRGDGIVIDAAA